MRYIEIHKEIPHYLFLPYEEYGPAKIPIQKIIGISRDLDLDFVGDFDGFFSNKENFEMYCSKIDPVHLYEYQGNYYVGDNGNKRVVALKNIGQGYGITEVWAKITKFVSTDETERIARAKYEEFKERSDEGTPFEDLR